ncbi:MAG: hypothetical protein ACI86M_001316, partial [Saprospiraceae bacterium]
NGNFGKVEPCPICPPFGGGLWRRKLSSAFFNQDKTLNINMLANTFY